MLHSRKVAIIGCGDIARREHVPLLYSRDPRFRLVATADPNARLPDLKVTHYLSHRELLAAEPDVTAVVICTPTFTHFEIARDALRAGRHTLLEKPPTSQISELRELHRIAEQRGAILYTSFHAQHNDAVLKCAELLSGAALSRDLNVSIEWREDFQTWHRGQLWPWQRGGCGVFDSGINALSILTRVLPEAEFRVVAAKLVLPADAETPFLANLRAVTANSGSGTFRFEWTKQSGHRWEIAFSYTNEHGEQVTTKIKDLTCISRNGEVVFRNTSRDEYLGVYRKFATAIDHGVSQVSYREMEIMNQAFQVADVMKSDFVIGV